MVIRGLIPVPKCCQSQQTDTQMGGCKDIQQHQGSPMLRSISDAIPAVEHHVQLQLRRGTKGPLGTTLPGITLYIGEGHVYMVHTVLYLYVPAQSQHPAGNKTAAQTLHAHPIPQETLLSRLGCQQQAPCPDSHCTPVDIFFKCHFRTWAEAAGLLLIYSVHQK